MVDEAMKKQGDEFMGSVLSHRSFLGLSLTHFILVFPPFHFDSKWLEV